MSLEEQMVYLYCHQLELAKDSAETWDRTRDLNFQSNALSTGE